MAKKKTALYTLATGNENEPLWLRQQQMRERMKHPVQYSRHAAPARRAEPNDEFQKYIQERTRKIRPRGGAPKKIRTIETIEMVPSGEDKTIFKPKTTWQRDQAVKGEFFWFWFKIPLELHNRMIRYLLGQHKSDEKKRVVHYRGAMMREALSVFLRKEGF